MAAQGSVIFEGRASSEALGGLEQMLLDTQMGASSAAAWDGDYFRASGSCFAPRSISEIKDRPLMSSRSFQLFSLLHERREEWKGYER
jgi:hypothetical protein